MSTSMSIMKIHLDTTDERLSRVVPWFMCNGFKFVESPEEAVAITTDKAEKAELYFNQTGKMVIQLLPSSPNPFQQDWEVRKRADIKESNRFIFLDPKVEGSGFEAMDKAVDFLRRSSLYTSGGI